MTIFFNRQYSHLFPTPPVDKIHAPPPYGQILDPPLLLALFYSLWVITFWQNMLCTTEVFSSFTAYAVAIYSPVIYLSLLRKILFSSPEHKVIRVSYCDRSLSVVRRASSVVRRASSVVRKLFLLKHLLLWNRLLDFDQTSQEWCLCGPLPKFFKLFQLVA